MWLARVFSRFINSMGEFFIWLFSLFGVAIALAVVIGTVIYVVGRKIRKKKEADRRERSYYHRDSFMLEGVTATLVVFALFVTPLTGMVSGHDTVVRQGGYTVEQSAQPEYANRPPLAVCTARLTSELGRLAGDPIRASVNYRFEDGEGLCSMVIDQRSIRRGLIGVVEWNYDADRINRCEATGMPAFSGWGDNSLRAEAASTQNRRRINKDDLIGRCGEHGAEVYAPAVQFSGTGRFSYNQHAGMYVFAAEADGQDAQVTWHAEGDAETFGFSAPFYPARLASNTIAGHRNADPSLGWFRRAGIICPSDVTVYEAVQKPSGSSEESGAGIDGNVREFTLMRADGSRLDAVTPMWRCGSSESITGVATIQLDRFSAGRFNPVVLHERETELLPLAQMAQSIAELPQVRVASRLQIHEVTPVSDDTWVALVGTERRVTFGFAIPAGGGRPQLIELPFTSDEEGIPTVETELETELETGEEPTPSADNETSAEIAELREEIERLADVVESLIETLEAQQSDS